uniref:Uncharacterized protein n=1 Tax=Tanacetum cinerariifolium TaxID=118510 RepID=A0A6L2KUC2_TANCI|nr:hypothetical protein [Tanacetum cinerariifolium]
MAMDYGKHDPLQDPDLIYLQAKVGVRTEAGIIVRATVYQVPGNICNPSIFEVSIIATKNLDQLYSGNQLAIAKETGRRLGIYRSLPRMTGDGVNDAPALKKADIEIVVADATYAASEGSLQRRDMGYSGTRKVLKPWRGILSW